MVDLKSIIVVITSSANDLNIPRKRLSDWIFKKARPNYMLSLRHKTDNLIFPQKLWKPEGNEMANLKYHIITGRVANK